jgi:hypothetical protein
VLVSLHQHLRAALCSGEVKCWSTCADIHSIPAMLRRTLASGTLAMKLERYLSFCDFSIMQSSKCDARKRPGQRSPGPCKQGCCCGQSCSALAGQQAVSALTVFLHAALGEAAHSSLVLLAPLLACVEVQVGCFLVQPRSWVGIRWILEESMDVLQDDYDILTTCASVSIAANKNCSRLASQG